MANPLAQDRETRSIARGLWFDFGAIALTCNDGRHAVRQCFDALRNRHKEAHVCVEREADGQLRRTTERARFFFSASALPGADAQPIYRCVRNGVDMPSKSPTCGGWNVAPAYELGYSWPRTRAGVSEVFRCRRVGPTADHFVSRDPACGGHVREASLGFAL